MGVCQPFKIFLGKLYEDISISRENLKDYLKTHKYFNISMIGSLGIGGVSRIVTSYLVKHGEHFLNIANLVNIDYNPVYAAAVDIVVGGTAFYLLYGTLNHKFDNTFKYAKHLGRRVKGKISRTHEYLTREEIATTKKNAWSDIKTLAGMGGVGAVLTKIVYVIPTPLVHNQLMSADIAPQTAAGIAHLLGSLVYILFGNAFARWRNWKDYDAE